MAKRFFCLLLTAAAFVLLAPFHISAQKKKPASFDVGLILPLSGPLAEYGAAFRNGAAMAREDRPELFERVRFIIEDSKYDAKAAVSAFNKLRQVNDVSLIFVWGNPTSEAVGPLAERYKLPTIASVMNPSVSQNKQYTIRATNHAAMLSRLLSEYLVEQGYSKIGVVIAENSYLNGVLDGLRAALPAGISLEVVDNYQPGDNDFRASVAKIKSAGYDSVGVFLMSGQIAQFYRQFASQQVVVPTFGTDFFESTTEIEQSGGAMDGAVYPHFGVSSEFRKRYKKRFGNDLQLTYAGNGYDMAVLIAETASKLSKGAAAETIMPLLKSREERSGVEGPFRYRETPEGGAYYEFPIHIKRIDGTEFKKVKSS